MSEPDYLLAHSLSAVLGWMELGNSTEARSELRSLPEEYKDRPEVLDVEWVLDAEARDWASALKVAERLVEIAPENPSGWLHRAYALRRVPEGGLRKAAEVLRPAVDHFPKEPIIPCNLSCYACQCGDLEDARRWLKKACACGKKGRIKLMALADNDLEELWPEIRKW